MKINLKKGKDKSTFKIFLLPWRRRPRHPMGIISYFHASQRAEPICLQQVSALRSRSTMKAKPSLMWRHTASWVHSMTPTRFTSIRRLHVLVPSVWSLWNGILLPIPALLIQISNPPYVATCLPKAFCRSPAQQPKCVKIV